MDELKYSVVLEKGEDNMQWKNVYIFVSSTFNDMHAERDYLVKRVFPDLAAWCAERKLRLYDVDLRWGISEEDVSKNKKVVDICLSNIDTCRPFFLSFLGQRRGWQPTSKEISQGTFDKFPNLKNDAGKRSITELEIIHAIKSFADSHHKRSLINTPLFFFRKSDYLKDATNTTPELKRIYTNYSDEKSINQIETEDVLLSDFKKEMIESDYFCCSYSAEWDSREKTPELGYLNDSQIDFTKGRLVNLMANEEPLKNIILDELKRLISTEYERAPELKAPSSLEKELMQQELFLTSQTGIYIPEKDAVNTLKSYLCDSGQKLLIIKAKAGMGKTTFLANFIAELVANNTPNIFYRFLGVSDSSMTVQSVVSSIYRELILRKFILQSDLPKNPLNNSREFLVVLKKAAANQKILLFLDGLDQITGNIIDNFDFLSSELPANIKIITTIKSGENDLFIEKKHSQGALILDYLAFSNEEKRGDFISEYLFEFLKTIDEDQRLAIVSLPNSNNPLFLKILLNELRVYGSFEGLMEKISLSFGNSPETAFIAVLERLETDPAYTLIPPNEAVPVIFGHMSVARRGVSLRCVIDIFKDIYVDKYSDEQIADTFFLYVNQMRNFVIMRDGLFGFFYESVKKACATKYNNLVHEEHRRIVSILQSYADPSDDRSWKGTDLFAFNELIFHMHSLDVIEAERILCSFAFLKSKIDISGIYELLNDFILFPKKCSPALTYLNTALVFASSALEENKSSLTEQLWLRLYNVKENTIKQILEDARKDKQQAWLKAIKATTFDVASGLLNTIQFEDDYFELIGIDKHELFLKSANTVYILDKSTFALIKTISCDFQIENSKNKGNHYADFSDIPNDSHAKRFMGITKVKNNLVFRTEDNLSIYDLEQNQFYQKFIVSNDDVSLLSKRILKKYPEIINSSFWHHTKIDIYNNTLFVLFEAKNSILHLIKSYNLETMKEGSFIIDVATKVKDFLCNGNLAYIYADNNKSEKRRMLVSLKKGKCIRHIKEKTLQEDQICFFDDKFFFDNQVFDGIRGALVGSFEALRFYYIYKNADYLVCASVKKNLTDTYHKKLRVEQTTADNAGTISFWKRGDKTNRAFYRIAYSDYRWKQIVGDFCVLEKRKEDQVILLNLKELFDKPLSEFSDYRNFKLPFSYGFNMEMSSSDFWNEFSYTIDLQTKQLFAVERNTLKTIAMASSISFGGSIIPSQYNFDLKNKKFSETEAFKIWMSRKTCAKGREFPQYKKGLSLYYLSGDQLLIFFVHTQKVEVYNLPKELTINMPENTSTEIWEQVLKRSSDNEKRKSAKEEINKIRIAQKAKIIGIKDDVLFFASVFNHYLVVSSFDYKNNVFKELLVDSLPEDKDNVYTEFDKRVILKEDTICYKYTYSGTYSNDFYVVYNLQKQHEVHRTSNMQVVSEFLQSHENELEFVIYDSENGIELQKQQCGKVVTSSKVDFKSSNSSQIFWDSQISQNYYVMLNENLIFQIEVPVLDYCKL